MISRFSTGFIRPRLENATIILLIGVFAVLQIANVAPLAALRHVFFDFAQSVLPAPELNAPVTVVAIDDASIAAFGQWPWPRDRIAELVGLIARSGPAVVGLDLIFPEPDRLSPENVLAGYEVSPFVREQLASLPTNDQALASSLRAVPSVLASAPAAQIPNAGTVARPRTPINLQLGWQATLQLRRYPGLLSSLPILEDASSGSGVASVELDRDGVIRRLPAVFLVDNALVPGFAIELARIFFGGDAIGVEIDGAGIAGVTIGSKEIETDSGGKVWLRSAPIGDIPYLSAASVLYDRVDPAEIEGRAVLIGVTGTGLARSFVSPRGEVLSALEVQALAVGNLLSGLYLHRPQYSLLLEILATIVGGVGIVLLRHRLRTLGGQALVFLYAAFLLGIGLVLFETQQTIFDPMSSLVAMLAVYLVFTGFEIVEMQKERRRIEETRRTALVLAESASQSKTNFLAGMSHELRTPLNAIIGFSEMIKDGVLGPVSPPNYVNYAKDIHVSAEHLLEVVTQILDMANLESGDTRLNVSEFELAALVAEAIGTFEKRSPEAVGKIVVETSGPMPVIRADHRMLSQMFLNLLVNAVKFSSNSGLVKVSTGYSGNGSLRLAVTDSGRGMSAKQVAEAFEMFQNYDQTISDSIRGVGLGLPITTAMIEMHGGTIEVDSKPGVGTRMTLVIPANRVVREARGAV